AGTGGSSHHLQQLQDRGTSFGSSQGVGRTPAPYVWNPFWPRRGRLSFGESLRRPQGFPETLSVTQLTNRLQLATTGSAGGSQQRLRSPGVAVPPSVSSFVRKNEGWTQSSNAINSCPTGTSDRAGRVRPKKSGHAYADAKPPAGAPDPRPDSRSG